MANADAEQPAEQRADTSVAPGSIPRTLAQLRPSTANSPPRTGAGDDAACVEQPDMCVVEQAIRGELDDGWTLQKFEQADTGSAGIPKAMTQKLVVTRIAFAQESTTFAAEGMPAITRCFTVDSHGQLLICIGGCKLGPSFLCTCSTRDLAIRGDNCICISGAVQDIEARARGLRSGAMSDSALSAKWKEITVLLVGSEVCAGVRNTEWYRKAVEDPSEVRKLSARVCEQYTDDGAVVQCFKSPHCSALVFRGSGVGQKAHMLNGASVCDQCYNLRNILRNSAIAKDTARILSARTDLGRCSRGVACVQLVQRHDLAREENAALKAEIAALRQQIEQTGVRVATDNPKKQEMLDFMMTEVKRFVEQPQAVELMTSQEYRKYRAMKDLEYSYRQEQGTLSGMRWDNRTFALAWKATVDNPSAAAALHQSGLFTLPDYRLMKRYRSKRIAHINGNSDAFYSELGVRTAHLTGQARLGVLGFDGIHVEQDVIMSKLGNGELDWWGSVSRSEQAENGGQLALASEALVFLFQPLMEKKKKKGERQESYVGGVFPGSSFDAGRIGHFADQVKGNLYLLARLEVIAHSCDGLAANRLYFKVDTEGMKAFCSGAYEFRIACASSAITAGGRDAYIMDPTHNEKKAVRLVMSSRVGGRRSMYNPLLGECGWITRDTIIRLDKWQTDKLVKLYHTLSKRVVDFEKRDAMSVPVARALMNEGFLETIEWAREHGFTHAQFTEGFVGFFKTMLEIHEPLRGGGKGFSSSKDPRLLQMIDALAALQEWHDSFATAKARARGFLSSQFWADLHYMVHGFQGVLVELERRFGVGGFAPIDPTSAAQDRLERLFGQARALKQGGQINVFDLMCGIQTIVEDQRAVNAQFSLCGKRSREKGNCGDDMTKDG